MLSGVCASLDSAPCQIQPFYQHQPASLVWSVSTHLFCSCHIVPHKGLDESCFWAFTHTHFRSSPTFLHFHAVILFGFNYYYMYVVILLGLSELYLTQSINHYEYALIWSYTGLNYQNYNWISYGHVIRLAHIQFIQYMCFIEGEMEKKPTIWMAFVQDT